MSADAQVRRSGTALLLCAALTALATLATLATLTTLVGCGFQLRGQGSSSGVPEAWRSMHLISANPNAEFTRIVESTFSANGINWQSREDASYILRLGPEQFTQRNLSINAEARAAEFDLQMRAEFVVFDREGRVVIENGSAAVNKQMENDPQNVVGKAEEVRILRSELRSELANQILRRISFFAASEGSG